MELAECQAFNDSGSNMKPDDISTSRRDVLVGVTSGLVTTFGAQTLARDPRLFGDQGRASDLHQRPGEAVGGKGNPGQRCCARPYLDSIAA